jgi:hypothetical protein
MASTYVTAPGIGCRTPHSLDNHALNKLPSAVPDWPGAKAFVAMAMARATKHR